MMMIIRIFWVTCLFASNSVFAQTTIVTQSEAEKGGSGPLLQRVERLERILDNQVLYDLVQQLDALNNEVRELRGEVENLNFELAELKKRQRDLYLDTDRRLQELETVNSSGTGSSGQTPQHDGSSGFNSEQVGEASAGQILPQPVPVDSSASAQTPTASTTTASSQDEKTAYVTAFEYLKQGRYDAAISAFKSFLQQYPSGRYSANARYWLGEASYVTRQFEAALQEFQAVIDRHPASSKVADARLKMGYTYYELEQWEQARQTLQSLIADFPDSSVARLADKRLQRMLSEGH